MTTVPGSRLLAANAAPPRQDGGYVLYWMIAHRRARWNFALQHACDRAREHGVPLLVLEALRLGHRWSSARVHAFVLDGMADNARDFDAAGVRHYPYVEAADGDGRGLLEALAARASLVVTDHFPCYFLPSMVAAAAARLDVRLESVDGNGLLPLRAADRAFSTAHSFRRFLQKNLRAHLDDFPEPDPLAGYDGGRATVPRAVRSRWPMATKRLLGVDRVLELAFRCDVPAVALRGGRDAAERTLATFLDERLPDYVDGRQRERAASSGLSPYLHFGHVSAHQVVADVLLREHWDPGRLAAKTDGCREGWWGATPAAEALLDQVVTWREVGYVFCDQRPDDYDRYESLPDWARATLAAHARDPRSPRYDFDALDGGATHDELWNAAQHQLRRDGRIHNYLRMLWGKKILEWSPSPEAALDVMIELNNRYALDGRNPNSYSGIFWVLGRFDRAWGPERPIFGKVRYMSSANTARKLRR